MTSNARPILFSRFFNSKVIKKCREVSGVMFNKYLLLTNVGLSISLSGAGDILQQNYEIVTHKRESWDRVRTHHMSLTGMTVGLFCHYWYIVLDKMIPGRTIKIVVKKVIVDQIICSPVCIMTFFATLGYLDHSSMEEIKNEVIFKGKRLYIAEWMVWPPAQVLNFYVLPTRFRVLYDNTISLGYDVYTSYVKHDDSVIPQDTNYNKIEENAENIKSSSKRS